MCNIVGRETARFAANFDFTISSNYRDLTKFASKTKNGYIQLRSALKRWM
jgi:hypothetical protein